ncbi:MAG: alpha/beta hydrolase [Faecousia sp.]
MVSEYFEIRGIPAVLYGERADRLWLFVHGKCGNKEEACGLVELLCPKGYQVLGVDLPEHGARKGGAAKLLPWEVIPELQGVLTEMKQRWQDVSLYANSIGAYFSLLAFPNERFTNCLFVSPILDMVALIERMMGWVSVSAERLQAEREIPTPFGETLSWAYYTYAKQHPIQKWDSPTAILYAGKDELTDRATVTSFAERFGCALQVYEDGEHWFHTEKQLAVLREFIKRDALA